MTEEYLPKPVLQEPEPQIGAYRIAMVIDGVIHMVLNLEAPDAARYLSSPIFVQIPRSQYVVPGDFYKNETFIQRI